ncbi:hypothetical protein MCHUDSM44219_04084 [Mycolicibacterium chubuense]|uniref:Uncharacterized protein n=1 Tax=Mycolicibacterium chubuense TaxID=1800 RepID=A0A0J6VV68_MYCCU|nr:hypothetical protein MCHUDSM44219_04084 [Mycolicibacterium chubuense]SPX97828.1 Uncharacterised protein [Mycolicibacterium chubuense]
MNNQDAALACPGTVAQLSQSALFILPPDERSAPHVSDLDMSVKFEPPIHSPSVVGHRPGFVGPVFSTG